MDISVPLLGDVEEVTVVRWLKQAGDEVEAGEVVAEVEADKAVFAIEAPAAGRLTEILAAEGSRVKPGAVIGKLEER